MNSEPVQFELHAAPVALADAGVSELFGSVRFNEVTNPHSIRPLVVPSRNEMVWVARDATSGNLTIVGPEGSPLAGFAIAKKGHQSHLVMLPRHGHVSVNGTPVSQMTCLFVKDYLVLETAVHAVVTQRVRPYVGPTPSSLVGKPCPFCRIPLSSDSRVVVCRCGAAYHWEEALAGATETNSGGSDNDDDGPLRCYENIRTCQVCQRPLMHEEHLAWNPAEIV